MSLQDDLRSLDARLGPDPDTDRLHQVLASTDLREVIGSAHETLANGSDPVLDWPAGSYVHPNGFAKVVLGHLAHGGALRAHLWERPISEIDNDIHDHRGAFASSVLAGELRDQHYEIVPDGETWDYFLDAPSGTRNRHELTPDGARSLQLVQSVTRRQGTSYSLDGTELHRSTPSELPTLTIVLEMTPDRSVSNVFRRPGTARPLSIETNTASIDELRATVGRMASLC
jgi:hypothetical protein